MTPPTESAHDTALSRCAREPIHTPGAIQPYGVLLVVEPQSLQVRERAISHPGLLKQFGEPLMQHVSEVLGGVLAPFQGVLQQATVGSSAHVGAVHLDGHGRHQLLVHRSATDLLVELEAPVPGQPGSLEELYPAIRELMTGIESAATVEDLCRLAAAHMRRLTGFDRTLVYQFDAGWNGIVVAEDGNGLLPSYLDLRFPESDIPAQARELYRRNRVRLIADNNYTPTPLMRAEDHREAPPTDLSLAVLRSVSPVHLQYMRNMGTGASMSVSLVHEGRLWGLVSCHTVQPRRLPYHVRTACEFMGQILSLQIALKERALAIEERVARRSILVKLLGRMAGDEEFMAALRQDEGSLLSLTGAAGAAIVHKGDCMRVGECPPASDVLALADWLATRQAGQETYCTDHLAADWSPAAHLADVASGLLAVSISQLHDSYLMWFRPEVVRTVRWGGRPPQDRSARRRTLPAELLRRLERDRAAAQPAVDRRRLRCGTRDAHGHRRYRAAQGRGDGGTERAAPAQQQGTGSLFLFGQPRPARPLPPHRGLFGAAWQLGGRPPQRDRAPLPGYDRRFGKVRRHTGG